MDRNEAFGLLRAKLEDYHQLPYTALTSKVEGHETIEVIGPSGAEYQIEIQVVWDGKALGDIRVLGAIDDGSIREISSSCDLSSACFNSSMRSRRLASSSYGTHSWTEPRAMPKKCL